MRRGGTPRLFVTSQPTRIDSFGTTEGQPGEVTTAALDAAIDGTAQNPSGIGPHAGGFSDPPTQAEVQAFAAYVETLRVALTR
jgi:hypothetical protein